MFKVGDKVKCVKVSHGQSIEIGRVYTVSELRPMNCIRLIEIKTEHSYYSHKFIKVSTFKGNVK